MFRKNKHENKAKLEHKLYLARENPEPIFDLSDCGIYNVPPGIYSLCRVFLKEVLRLENNRLSSLSGGGQLKDLQLLKVLNISNNVFNSLPDDIYSLTNLQELNVSYNQLKKLPDTICMLQNLVLLDVSNNLLKSLPETIGDLTCLKRINITSNASFHNFPKSICKAQKLTLIEVDVEYLEYPPKDVVERGTEDIMKYICNDTGYKYTAPEKVVEETADSKSKQEVAECEDHIQQQKIQDFLEIEKHNELLQRQELELATTQKENREKLLACITEEQTRFDSELNKLQLEKECERFKLIEQLQEAENNADLAIKQLLILNREPLEQLLQQEKLEEERLLTAISRCSDTLRKVDILAEMQSILTQETEKFQQFDQLRLEASRSILEQELETDCRLSKVLQSQDLHKAELVLKLQEDSDLQKAAVGTLLERGDARSWGLLQQVRLVESQLAALTHLEIDRKKLEMDQQINDLAEKRVNLSNLLVELLHQQKERRSQLLSTLQTMEEFNTSVDDFWLRQYQRLLDKLPEGLSQAQKNIDPLLAQALLVNGVIHCLPFLAKLTQKQYDSRKITEDELIEAGVSHKTDRIQMFNAFHLYEKERGLYCPELIPSAPLLLVEEASAPLPDHIRSITTSECVICLDNECQVIFVPCGHMCCCSKCSIPVKECPLCRSDIERKITSLVC